MGGRTGTRPEVAEGRLLMKDPRRPRKMPRTLALHRYRPDLFEADDYGLSSAVGDGTVPVELESAARLAIANCPEYAIEEISDDN